RCGGGRWYLAQTQACTAPRRTVGANKQGGLMMMSRIQLASLATATIAAAFTATAMAQAPAPPAAAPPAPPLFATTKVDGTDGVYIFRYQGHQAMFIVTPEGVIATDPIGERRPQAVTTYIAEIRKITQAPIRYVIYSHSHYDHIAGGKPFKDAGATFVAHENAKTLLQARKNPDIVIPDETVTNQRTITLGSKDDARAHLGYLKDLSAAVKEQVDAGKNYQEAMAIKLPKYESWGGYGPFLPMNIERYYDFWNRGI